MIEEILMTNKYIKTWLISLVIRKMQNENHSETPLHTYRSGGMEKKISSPDGGN